MFGLDFLKGIGQKFTDNARNKFGQMGGQGGEDDEDGGSQPHNLLQKLTGRQTIFGNGAQGGDGGQPGFRTPTFAAPTQTNAPPMNAGAPSELPQMPANRGTIPMPQQTPPIALPRQNPPIALPNSAPPAVPDSWQIQTPPNLPQIAQGPPAQAANVPAQAGSRGIIPLPPAMPQGVPGGAMPSAEEVGPSTMNRRGVPLPALPGQRNPTAWSPINQERYDFNTSRMKRDENGDLTSKYKRNWKDTLGNAFSGFAQGVAGAGPHDNKLAAGLGGLGVGLGGSLISPGMGTNYAFNTRHLPGLEQQQAEQSQIQQQQAAQLQAAMKAQQEQAQTEHLRAQTQNIINPGDQYGATSWGTYNKKTGKEAYVKPPGVPTNFKPSLYRLPDGSYIDVNGKQVGPAGTGKPLTQADALSQVIASDGSPESIAQSSLEGRKDSLMQKLTPEERAYLGGGGPSEEQLKAQLSPQQRAIIEGKGSGTPAEEAAAFKAYRDVQGQAQTKATQARNKWDKIQKDEYDNILKYTKGIANQKAAQKRGSGSGSAKPSTGGGARSLADVEKYLR